jgi:hypothetical protein
VILPNADVRVAVHGSRPRFVSAGFAASCFEIVAGRIAIALSDAAHVL